MSRKTMVRVATVLVLTVVAVLGVSILTTPAAAESCEPVICPAIIKICPQGQIACRPSPCNCALVCAAPGHGCNA